MPTPFLPFRTERLVLRPYAESDLDALLSYYSRPEVARHLLTRPWTPEVGRDVIAKRVQGVGLEAPGRALAVIVEHEGRVVGDVGLWATDETGAKGEMGWVFHPDCAGRGFATEAAAPLLRLLPPFADEGSACTDPAARGAGPADT